MGDLRTTVRDVLSLLATTCRITEQRAGFSETDSLR
jgi:hypothetical protein